MADSGFKNAMDVFDQLLAQQQAVAAQKPQGIFANVDPVMLGVAKGFLSPTRTGGFGESIGLGLAGAEAPLESIRKRQTDAQNKIMELQLARAKMQMEEPLISARAEYYSNKGLGGTGPSLSAQSEHLNRQWLMLNNFSAEDLGMTEEQLEEAKRNVARRMIQLDQGSSKGVSTDDGSSTGSGPFPEVKTEEDYKKLGPGVTFTYKGKQFTTPLAPANQPRG